jgi:hypothetical protein
MQRLSIVVLGRGVNSPQTHFRTENTHSHWILWIKWETRASLWLSVGTQVLYKDNIIDRSFNYHSMDHLHYRLNFDLNKSRQKFHHSLKEHRKISNIPKFRCEMLWNADNIALRSLPFFSHFVLQTGNWCPNTRLGCQFQVRNAKWLKNGKLRILEVTNARKLLPHGQNFGLGCSKSGYNPWIIQN